MSGREPVTVCYNGSCPVCAAEIGHYRKLAGETAALRLLDVAAEPEAAATLGIGGDIGFRRLHAVDPSGQVAGGVEAFLAVWDRLPRYARLARLVRYPLVRPLAEAAYERVAAPLLFAWHRRRMRRRAGGA